MNVTTNNPIRCTVALAALQNIMDPEIGLNVVDLGLIYEIHFNDDKHMIICSMTLTTQFCPMGESITDGVKKELMRAFPDDTIILELTFDPSWSYDRISDEGREFLGS